MLDVHAAIDRLGHVVYRQQADGGRGQGFHFNACLAVALGCDDAMNGALRLVNVEVDRDARQADRMAERDQVAGALGALNRGDPGNADDIALFCRAGADQGKRFRLHENAAAGTGDAGGFGLVPDIDHVGLAGSVEMGEILVGHGNLQMVTFGPESPAIALLYHSTMHLAQRLAAGILACTMVMHLVRADDLPELGDVAGNELSLATEKKVGRQIMNEIRAREPSYLDDSDVEAYLNQLGNRLAAASSDPGIGFVFFTINDPSINAFAMPGGFIGVHTGLILSAQTESELAGVLAHEISHVTQRHIARQVFQSKQMGMAAMLAMGLALLAARSNSQVAGAAMVSTQAGAMSAQLAFSRDYEREADRVGFEVMRKSGFDVRGMSGFFTRLQQSVRLYENNATAYLRTHPLTGERLSDMQNREQQVPYHQVPDGPDFQLVRAKIRAMLGTPAEARKDFDTQLRERKFPSEPATHYGMAYALYRARDWSGAEREVELVRKTRIASPMPDRLLADCKIAEGDVAGGLRVYRDAMVRFPFNQGLLYGYGSALVGAHHFDEALSFVATQLQNYPDDIRFYRMRAESYAGLGHGALQHQALAEIFFIEGQTPNAVAQLELAQKAGDANFYEMSAIDARLREFKRVRQEELKEKRNW